MQSQCIININTGTKNTANARLDHPSASPLMPQCVAICSGNSFQNTRPTIQGSNIIIEEINNCHLFFFIVSLIVGFLFSTVIFILSSQICNPKHDFLQNGDVQFVINKFSFPRVPYQIRIFQNGQMSGN